MRDDVDDVSFLQLLRTQPCPHRALARELKNLRPATRQRDRHGAIALANRA